MTRAELLRIAKPILFNTEMVKAILEGRKTATRRCVKPQQIIGLGCDKCSNNMPEEYIAQKKMLFKPWCDLSDNDLISAIYKSPYQSGDVLYVRETWQSWSCAECDGYDCEPDNNFSGVYCSEPQYLYKASHEETYKGWKPSIHMPKEAARIFLRVKDVQVERLQDITEEGVWDEGFRFKPPCLTRVSADGHCCNLDGPCTSSINYCDMTMGELFGRELWNSTIKKSDLALYGWDANPWVWVIEFERIKPESEV